MAACISGRNAVTIAAILNKAMERTRTALDELIVELQPGSVTTGRRKIKTRQFPDTSLDGLDRCG